MRHDDMRVVAVRVFLHGFEGKDARLHAPSRAPSQQNRSSFGTSELSTATSELVRWCSCPHQWLRIGSPRDMEEWCLQPRVTVVAPPSVISHGKLLLPPETLRTIVLECPGCLQFCGISKTLLNKRGVRMCPDSCRFLGCVPMELTS